jgi:hypothetical protein
VFQRRGIKVYENLSDSIQHLEQIKQRKVSDVEENTQFYSSNAEVASIDAFMCSFPTTACQLWIPQNKPIVFMPCHRYNMGSCTHESWGRLNNDIKKLAADPSGRHTIAAMSRYDVEYLKYYTGLSPELLSSFSGYYTQGHEYNPTRQEVPLITCSWKPEWGEKLLSPDLINTLAPEINVVQYKKLYPQGFSLDDLVSHRAIIMLPYSVMSYKLTEFYSLSIPLFVPSPKFFMNNNGIGDDRSLTHNHCDEFSPNIEIDMRPKLEYGYSSHIYSPNLVLVIIKNFETKPHFHLGIYVLRTQLFID